MVAAAVKPLILSNSTAQIVAFASFGIGWLLEAWQTWRTRLQLGVETDRGTFWVFGIGIAAAILVSARAWQWAPGMSISDGGVLPVVVGLTVFWSGIALRWWSIATLGELFQLTVVVQQGHRVVTSGPYRLVRHPGYLGMWIAVVGIGITLDNWLAVGACIVLSPMGMIVRIRVEERVLEEQLGAPYLAYESRSKRLIPGIW